MQGGFTNTEQSDALLAGTSLYGDDFDAEEIRAWYEDEKDGYADLGAKDRQSYRYAYHEMNRYHIFSRLPRQTFPRVLGLGSAYGDEFAPIARRIGALTIVDPSETFIRQEVHGVPAEYLRPSPTGMLPLPAGRFDLVTCFGVLHHIPNVSTVLTEIARVMAPDGYVAIREPIVSLGDWRLPRKGLTRRERGIPFTLLKDMAAKAGLETRHSAVCAFPLTVQLCPRLGFDLFNSRWGTRIDALLSSAFRWNQHYHARNNWQRFRPTVGILVLRKPPPL